MKCFDLPRDVRPVCFVHAIPAWPQVMWRPMAANGPVFQWDSQCHGTHTGHRTGVPQLTADEDSCRDGQHRPRWSTGVMTPFSFWPRIRTLGECIFRNALRKLCQTWTSSWPSALHLPCFVARRLPCQFRPRPRDERSKRAPRGGAQGAQGEEQKRGGALPGIHWVDPCLNQERPRQAG